MKFYIICFITGNQGKKDELRKIVNELNAEQRTITGNTDQYYCGFISLANDVPEIQSRDTEEVAIEKIEDTLNAVGNISLDAIQLDKSDEDTLLRELMDPYNECQVFFVVDDTGLSCQYSKLLDTHYTNYPGALIKFHLDAVNTTKNDPLKALKVFCKQFGGSTATATVSLGISCGYTLDSTTMALQVCHPRYRCVSANIEGMISETLKTGEYGFGWDACFVPFNIGLKDNDDELSFAQIPPEQKNKCSMRYMAVRKLFDFIETWQG